MTPKGIFVGLNTIDIQFLIDMEIKTNTKYKANKNEIFVGGPATNAAICFSHLGGDTTLFTPVGNHHFTNFIQDDLKTYNINLIDPIQSQNAEATIASIITTKMNGDRTVFSYHPKEIVPPNSDYKLDDYDIILIDGFHIETSIEIISRFNSVPIVLDGGSWKPNMDKLLEYIDIAICSENFLPPKAKNQDDVFNFLLDKGIDKVAITNGEKPIHYSINGSKGQIYVDSVKTIDTLGAGDFFHGAFCYYFAIDKDFIGSLLKASKIASESCKYFGTREWMNVQNEDGKKEA